MKYDQEVYEALAENERNQPVAWMNLKISSLDYKFSDECAGDWNIPLYTHPVKELTDKEILEVAVEAWGSGHEIFWFDDDGINLFARAIMKRCGIISGTDK